MTHTPEYSAEWRRDHPVSYRQSARLQNLKKYNLTEDEYEALLVAQGGGCYICGKTREEAHPRSRRRLAVDHDHITGRVRGIVCFHCNHKLGWYEQHRERIRAHLQENPCQ